MSRTSSERHPVPQPGLPFSRRLEVDTVPDDGLAMSIEADAAECTAIAAEIDVPAMSALAATYQITRLPGGRMQVDGMLAARITQVCVVSLDPFESDVSQPIELTFAPVKTPLAASHVRKRNERGASRRSVGQQEVVVAPPPSLEGEADPPDPIVDGRIDLGSVAVEFLALALDLYPKKPGVHFTDVLIGETDDPKPSAFAALERFKDRS